MKKAAAILFLFILVSGITAQDIADPLDPVIKTIQDADAKALSAFFNPTVEMKLPDHENTYSSSQSEMIMKDFFKKSPPSSFSIIQKGSTDNTSRFAICDYLSGQMHYQVYIYLKKEQERYLLHKIKFEEKK